MRKLLIATALLILGTAGTAAADRYRGDNHRQDRRERVVVRDRGWNNRARPVVHHHHRPVYNNNNRYTFQDGRSYQYRRPVINVRYTDYRYRPTLLVENYDTVPGYLWVAGNWQWSGYEWNWVSGHYEVSANYGANYNNANYNNTNYYDNTNYDNAYDNAYSPSSNSSGYTRDCD